MLFVHWGGGGEGGGGGGGGGVKINIVKFVWGSILNLLKLWGGLFLIRSYHRKILQPPLLLNNDRSLKRAAKL